MSKFIERARFDPQGLMSDKRERLQSTVNEWITRR
jgi:hypothetical protein